MKKTLCFALLLASSFACAAPIPKAIRASYSSLGMAIDKLDFAKFSSFFAPEFVNVDPDGKETKREEFLAGVKPLFDGATSAKHRERLLSATKKDDEVAVMFDLTLDLKGPKGVTHVHEVGTDYWKKIGGKWLFVRTVDTKFEVKAPTD